MTDEGIGSVREPSSFSPTMASSSLRGKISPPKEQLSIYLPKAIVTPAGISFNLDPLPSPFKITAMWLHVRAPVQYLVREKKSTLLHYKKRWDGNTEVHRSQALPLRHTQVSVDTGGSAQS